MHANEKNGSEKSASKKNASGVAQMREALLRNA